MAKMLFYDKENDIFSVHKGFSANEKFKGNIDAGDLILDVSTKGKIRGIEVLNATKFFKEFDIDEEKLENITEADFDASIKPNGVFIGIAIKSKNHREMQAKIAVPLEEPVTC